MFLSSPPTASTERLIVFQKNRHRNKTARTPQLPRNSTGNSHYRIIAAQQDVPVMHQEIVGETVQSTIASRLSIAIGSSLRLPLVITKALNPPSASSR